MTLASLELPSFRPQHLQVRQNLLLLEVPVPPLEAAPAGTALGVQREPFNRPLCFPERCHPVSLSRYS